jgi:outer membrane protein assembly factor BamB
MKKFKWPICIMLGVLFLASSSAGNSQDWPQWRGPNRDGKVTGFKAPGWPGTLNQQWKITVGTGDATPALVGNRLYAFTRQGDNEVVLCLDAGDGKEIWRHEYAAQAVTGAGARHPGPRSSPAVSDGKVFTIGVGGVLSCLDAASGKLLWRKDPFPKVVPQFFTSMSPIVVDGICIAQLGGAGNGAILGYDVNSGQEKWRRPEEGPEYASPALMTVDGITQIVTLAEKSIVGISVADGSLLWKLPFAPVSRAYNAATPIVDGQVVIYTGASRGTKAVRIDKKGNAFSASELWSNPDVSVQFNTPVLKDNMIFGSTNQGQLFCLDARTGKTLWMDETPRDRSGFTSTLDVGSAIMALPSNSQLIVYRPAGKGFDELASLKVADTPTYAHPVISGNRIFIKDQESIILWTIK